MITVRGSSLGRFLACPASIDPPKTPIVYDNRPARIGSAVHWLLQAMVEGGDVGIADAAEKYNVASDEIVPLFFAGKRAWDKHLAELFPDPICEVEIEYKPIGWESTIRLWTCTPDVISIDVDGDTVLILDWKTGRTEADHEPQMRAYMAAALQKYHGATYAQAYVCNVRQGTLELAELDRADLPDFDRELLDAAQEHAAGIEKAGEQCTYCPRRNECRTRAERIGSTLAIAGNTQTWDLAQFTPEKLLEIWDMIGPAKKYLKDVGDTIESMARGGAVPWLVRGEKRGTRDADPVIALRVAADLGIESSSAVKVSLPTLEKLARAAGKAKEFSAELEAREGVTVPMIETWTRNKNWRPE